MWGMLGFGWARVSVLAEQGVNVTVHRKSTCSIGVVPGEVNAGTFCSQPVGSDSVVELEG